MQRLLALTRALVALALRSVETVGHAVSLQQFRALYVLDHGGPCNATGLAEQLGTHASTVTRLCDRLVALGYATPEVKPGQPAGDRARRHAAGREIVAAVLDRRAAELRRIVETLPEDTLDCVLGALPQLVAAAEDQHGALPGGLGQLTGPAAQRRSRTARASTSCRHVVGHLGADPPGGPGVQHDVALRLAGEAAQPVEVLAVPLLIGAVCPYGPRLSASWACR